MKKLIIDAGNGNVKVCCGGETAIIPSIFSENDGDHIRGGFSLNGKDYVLGWDNEGRLDATKIVEVDDGKLIHLDLLICGSISAMKHVINPDDEIELYLTTLNSKRKDDIHQIVRGIKKLSIDGVPYAKKLIPAGVLPEGFGAALTHLESERIGVLDVGFGTINFSQYFIHERNPRRESLKFQPSGVSSLLKIVQQIYVDEFSSNGQVDMDLLTAAMTSNSYIYRSNYEGREVEQVFRKAITKWLHTKEVKEILNKVINLLWSGVPVVGCGGGFGSRLIVEAVNEILNKHGSFSIASNPQCASVVGIYEHLIKAKQDEANSSNSQPRHISSAPGAGKGRGAKTLDSGESDTKEANPTQPEVA